MKPNYLRKLGAMATGVVALASVACGQPDQTAAAPLQTMTPPSQSQGKTEPSLAGPTIISADPGSAIPAVISWADIENDSYDLRAHFIGLYKQMEAKVDEQVAKLKVKRATMTGTTDTQDWDFAMTEEGNARDYLRSIGDELSQATQENWTEERAKAGRAWARTQDAYDKVKKSTTS
jgi:hypothetical protein